MAQRKTPHNHGYDASSTGKAPHGISTIASRAPRTGRPALRSGIKPLGRRHQDLDIDAGRYRHVPGATGPKMNHLAALRRQPRRRLSAITRPARRREQLPRVPGECARMHGPSRHATAPPVPPGPPLAPVSRRLDIERTRHGRGSLRPGDGAARPSPACPSRTRPARRTKPESNSAYAVAGATAPSAPPP